MEPLPVVDILNEASDPGAGIGGVAIGEVECTLCVRHENQGQFSCPNQRAQSNTIFMLAKLSNCVLCPETPFHLRKMHCVP